MTVKLLWLQKQAFCFLCIFPIPLGTYYVHHQGKYTTLWHHCIFSLQGRALSQRTFKGGLFWCNRYIYVPIMHSQHTGVSWMRYTKETGGQKYMEISLIKKNVCCWRQARLPDYLITCANQHLACTITPPPPSPFPVIPTHTNPHTTTDINTPHLHIWPTCSLGFMSVSQIVIVKAAEAKGKDIKFDHVSIYYFMSFQWNRTNVIECHG